jgi:heptosyltransferase I
MTAAAPAALLAGAPKERVCIVMLSTVGGAVWTLPLINAIKRARRTHVAWVIQPGPATLVEGHEAVDELILFDRSKGLRGFLDVRRRLASQRFDVALAPQSYLKAGIVTSFVNAPIKLGVSRAKSRDANRLFTTHQLPGATPQHIQDDFLDFARALGIEPEPPEWNLGPWASERAWQREFYSAFDRPVAAIVVASTDDERDWPAERLAQVADALWFDYGLEPVLVGGTSARELRAKSIIDATARRPPRSALGSGLRRLVAILDGAALALSPDTGPLHIAAALDRPVISLMGYTNPKRKAPYRRYADLVVDAFGEPGENYTADEPNRSGRMTRISVRDVLDRVDVWQRRYATSSGPKS